VRCTRPAVLAAENGALLYTPSSWSERMLAKPAPPELAAALRVRGVRPARAGTGSSPCASSSSDSDLAGIERKSATLDPASPR
jgi:hypothetical protein